MRGCSLDRLFVCALICTTYTLATSSAVAATTTSAPRYRMTDLGSLGGTATEGININNAGTIVGLSFLPNDATHHAFRSNGVINPHTDDLGVPPGKFYSMALDINASGQIAAEAIIANGGGGVPPWRTYLIPPGGNMSTASDIQTLGGAYTFAEAINDQGQLTGWSGLSGGNWHAYLYTPGAGMLDLGAPNSNYSHAYDVNNSGQVVGWVDASNGSRAFRTQPNSPIRTQDYLGTLGGSTVGAKAINDAGQVAGYSDLAGSSASHAFRTRPNAGINPATDDLGGLPGSTLNEPLEINSQGDVVGWSFVPGGTRAFISYGDANTMYDLNDLIDGRGQWVFDLAEDINDGGVIVARAHLNGSGPDHAFLLTPLPEPSLAPVVVPLLLGFRRRYSR